jgi:integrase
MKTEDTIGKMRGGVRRYVDGGLWSYVIDLGKMPAQRCPACYQAKRRPSRWWVTGRKPLEACPNCKGKLESTTERRQEEHGGYATQKEALQARAKAVSKIADDQYTPRDEITVRDYLLDEWLPFIESGDKVKPSTALSYRGHCEKHIVPALGHVRLQRLSAAQIDRFITGLGNDVPGEHKALSINSRRHVFTTLQSALTQAVKWQRLRRSPATAAEKPARPHTEMQTWSRDELRAFLASVEFDRFFALWRLFAMTGCRRGEACGLQWRDLDLENGSMAIRRARSSVGYEVKVSSTKGKRARVVPIDARTTAVLTAYRSLVKDECRLRGGALEPSAFVFVDEAGEPVHPDWVTRTFDRHVAALKAKHAADHPKEPAFQRIRLHDVRHTYATLSLQAGVHPKIVSERLGHSSIAVTMDTYSHAIPTLQESAAELVAALVDAE